MVTVHFIGVGKMGLPMAVSQGLAVARNAAAAIGDAELVFSSLPGDAAQACTQAGIHYLRCTVSGNNKMAEAAQLSVMASGPREAYDRMLALLNVLGPNQFYRGADGPHAAAGTQRRARYLPGARI